MQTKQMKQNNKYGMMKLISYFRYQTSMWYQYEISNNQYHLYSQAPPTNSDNKTTIVQFV